MLLKQFVQSMTYLAINSYTKDLAGSSNANALNAWVNSNSNYVNRRGGSQTSGDFWYISLGSGETEPTYTDSQLASFIDNDTLTFNSGSVNYDYANGKIRVVNASFSNNTASPVTVKEIGLGYRTSQGNNFILMARSILDTPVTIGAGETYAFTYSLEV